ncbi:MAG: hypothetical protein ACQETX_08290 [Pseudomonadota bacterium]
MSKVHEINHQKTVLHNVQEEELQDVANILSSIRAVASLVREGSTGPDRDGGLAAIEFMAKHAMAYADNVEDTLSEIEAWMIDQEGKALGRITGEPEGKECAL